MTGTFLKLAACLPIFGLGLAGGLLPGRLGMGESGARLLVRANCFAAGVFMGAGFIHLLADAAGKLGALSHAMGDFPVAFLGCALGYTSIFGLEKSLAGGDRQVSYLLTAVLCAHALVAGTAVGLEPDFGPTVALLVAVLAHKWSAAFALGTHLFRKAVPVVSSIVIFSMATPLGILLGLYLSSQLEGPRADLVEGIFDSLAAGTFLYVAMGEIMAQEFQSRDDLFAKFSLVLAGLALMAALAIWS